MPSSWLSEVQSAFQASLNTERAQAQEAYMKNHFSFLGLSAPMRKEIQKPFVSKNDSLESLEKKMLLLWEQPYREYQYFALDLGKRAQKLFQPSSLNFLEKLITTKSWWDTVDLLASALLGPLALREPLIKREVSSWITSSDLWKRRSALLFQLKYKEQTDQKLLFELCKSSLEEKDFFMRKGIGWALREYSKTDPEAVSSFLDQYRDKASHLTLKEASKYL